MGKTKSIRVDSTLIDVFGNIGRAFAERIKKEYNLDTLFVPHTVSSQILAGKYRGQKVFNFKIRKTTLNSGVLEIE